MKVLQTIGGFGHKSGGTSTCTYDLINAMHRITDNVSVDLLTPTIDSDDDEMMGNGEPWIKTVDYDYILPIAYSRNIRRFIRRSDYDLYHTNGLWMDVNHATAAIARRMRKPYIITPHGMLYPQALRNSAKMKKIILALMYRRDIQNAAAIHVTCEEEMNHIRELGFTNPIAVIPNPVPQMPFIQPKTDKSVCRIGFLGRFHPIKNISSLIDAWHILGNATDNAELVIIGSGNRDYEMSLRNKVSQYGLSNVRFTGFISGEGKFRELTELSALVVPSHFENFGMIVTEALSMKVPVIASIGTPWRILEENRCGWWIDNDAESIANGIREVFRLTPQKRLEMGERGRRLVLENYLDSKIATKMAELYRWIVGEGPMPPFVHTL